MARLANEGASPASVSSTRENGIPVVKITGEVDLGSVEGVRSAVETAIAEGQERVVFDLSALEFMDSSGIALLLGVAERVPDVDVRDASSIVRQLIEMTGLSETLHLTP